MITIRWHWPRYTNHAIHIRWRRHYRKWGKPFFEHHLGLCMCGINEILKK